MKTKNLLLVFFVICSQLVFGQITFQKSFTDIPTDTSLHLSPYAIPYDIKETYDHGYIVTGAPFSLMKLDANGDTVWTKYSVSGSSVLQACDSGYITSGSIMSKTDSNGNVLWSKKYPSIGATNYTIRTNDCGYILASMTDSFGAGGYDMYVIKTDTGGNPLWSRTYGGAGDDEATGIQQTADGGYIIAGSTNSFGTSGSHSYLVKTDASGDTLWTKVYIGAYDNGGLSIRQTYDHGYIMLGTSLIKTDSMGNVMWSNTFNGFSIDQTLDSGYIFISRVSNQNGGFDLLLVKTNSYGSLLWARDFPGPPEGYRIGNVVLHTNDGGYVVTDYSQLTSLQYKAFYVDLMKTDANGQSGCFETNTTDTVSSASVTASGTATTVTSPVTTVITYSVNSGTDSMSLSTDCFSTGISERHSENSPIVYPNPVSPDGCISINLYEDLKGVEVTIFNIMGEVLYSEVANGTGQTILLQLKGKLSSGMYFLRIRQGENVCVQKIVVMG